MISHPKEDGFVHVTHMEYAADSGFTSTGVDSSWNTLLEGLHGYPGKEVAANEMDFIKDFIRNYSEWQHNQPVAAIDRPWPSPLLPSRTRSQKGASTPPPSLPITCTWYPLVAPHRPISPVIEGDQQPPPPPPPRQRTPPTHSLPPLPERPLPLQPGGFLLPRRIETNQMSTDIHHSHPHYSSVFYSVLFFFLLMVKFYRESPPSPIVLSHSISCNKSISPTVVPPHSASSMVSTGTVIRHQESAEANWGTSLQVLQLMKSAPVPWSSDRTLIEAHLGTLQVLQLMKSAQAPWFRDRILTEPNLGAFQVLQFMKSLTTMTMTQNLTQTKPKLCNLHPNAYSMVLQLGY